jgi:PIN domain nuclease of toxin-antitoxin system
LELPEPLEETLRYQLAVNRIELLPIDFLHALQVRAFPLYHKDPFDRLIIAQALSEHLPIVSSDANFDRYGIERIW